MSPSPAHTCLAPSRGCSVCYDSRLGWVGLVGWQRWKPKAGSRAPSTKDGQKKEQPLRSPPCRRPRIWPPALCGRLKAVLATLGPMPAAHAPAKKGLTRSPGAPHARALALGPTYGCLLLLRRSYWGCWSGRMVAMGEKSRLWAPRPKKLRNFEVTQTWWSLRYCIRRLPGLLGGARAVRTGLRSPLARMGITGVISSRCTRRADAPPSQGSLQVTASAGAEHQGSLRCHDAVAYPSRWCVGRAAHPSSTSTEHEVTIWSLPLRSRAGNGFATDAVAVANVTGMLP